ncbi:L-2-hydroxyglutarate oxidase [Patulibacter americanus]|uniref:L-2-hydroxyglutarate oxidase n=1 Tax=Patulibacter americanus TaxID=588672 RepID=UPI0003B74C69|nr:L-2-hydroxyglutarate oxidase [Patulibacter americanus]
MTGDSDDLRGPGAARADYDVTVVGAGIVGLATARELRTRRPDLRVAVVDGADEVAGHQTGHNSGVIHAGVYYAPGSLKARLCVEGARRMYAYCAERGIPTERVGKLVVAVDASELPRLDELERRSRANGVTFERVGPERMREIEPHCTGVAALHSPNTGIVDFAAVARALADDVRAAGGDVLLGRAVTGVGRRGDLRVLQTPQGPIVTRGLVGCAGAWADRLAVADGGSPDPRIVPFRGAYLRLRPEATGLVRGLIYPVPNPDLPFLGVHLTRHVSGDVLLGPTALLVGARDAYGIGRVRRRDLGATLRWPGTWRLARRFWRTGIAELATAVSRRAFVASAARYVPELTVEDVTDGWAGIRAQAVSRDGRLVDDFVFDERPGALHVRNAPSPAATSALAIAALVADRAGEVLELRGAAGAARGPGGR